VGDEWEIDPHPLGIPTPLPLNLGLLPLGNLSFQGGQHLGQAGYHQVQPQVGVGVCVCVCVCVCFVEYGGERDVDHLAKLKRKV